MRDLSAQTLGGGHIILHVICGHFTPLTRGWLKKDVIFIFHYFVYKVEKARVVKIGQVDGDSRPECITT